jgi:hypothetical protein
VLAPCFSVINAYHIFIKSANEDENASKKQVIVLEVKFKSSIIVIEENSFRGLVAHACDSSYSEGRDQEDQGSNTALGK